MFNSHLNYTGVYCLEFAVVDKAIVGISFLQTKQFYKTLDGV
jgi:hypothetical protein